MKIKHFVHHGVAPDGSVSSGGALEVNGRVIESDVNGGCGSEDCTCSPGHWIATVLPRTDDGIVFGYTAYFDNREELEAADPAEIEREARKLLN